MSHAHLSIVIAAGVIVYVAAIAAAFGHPEAGLAAIPAAIVLAAAVVAIRRL